MISVADPEPPESSDPLTRLADMVVFAPIGLAAVARERLPELAAEGRQRVEQRITVARFVGRMAIERGRRELEKRLQTATAPSDDQVLDDVVADDLLADHPPADGRPVTDPAMGDEIIAAPVSGAAGPDVPGAADLPIDDYESLAASQVVARLADLDREGLVAVETFERAHRNRRTVLGRIGQLRSDA